MRILSFVLAICSVFLLKTTLVNAFTKGRPQARLLSKIEQTQDHLSRSRYVLGGEYLNIEKGVYKVDCSGYINQLLKRTNSDAFEELTGEAKTNDPTTATYFEYIKRHATTGDSDTWEGVDKVQDLRPGDFIVFNYKNMRGKRVSGHIMVVLTKPIAVKNDPTRYRLKVADSSPYRHSNDTRAPGQNGVGEGSMMLKVDSKSGKPVAYAWYTNSRFKYTMKYAMARLV